MVFGEFGRRDRRKNSRAGEQTSTVIPIRVEVINFQMQRGFTLRTIARAKGHATMQTLLQSEVPQQLPIVEQQQRHESLQEQYKC